MPMNNRLLRPRQTIHPEAADWANRVRTNGGSVSGTTLTAVDRFVKAVYTAGIRDRFYRLNLFCGTGLEACLVPLFRSASFGGTTYGNATDTNNNFVAGDYAETGASGGLLGDAATKYLNTGFRTQDLPGVNDCHIAAWPRESNVDTTRRLIGAIGGTSDVYLIDKRTTAGGGLQARLGGASNFGTGAADASAQSMIASRTSSTSAVLYKNATSIITQTTTLSGVTLSTQVIGVFTALQSGTTPNGFFPHRLCGYSIGAGLTGEQATSFHNAWAAFQTSLTRGL